MFDSMHAFGLQPRSQLEQRSLCCVGCVLRLGHPRGRAHHRCSSQDAWDVMYSTAIWPSVIPQPVEVSVRGLHVAAPDGRRHGAGMLFGRASVLSSKLVGLTGGGVDEAAGHMCTVDSIIPTAVSQSVICCILTVD
jgi:hypothetical protein